MKHLVISIIFFSTTTYAYEFSEKKFEIKVGYVPSIESYDLAGQGFETNSGSTSGGGFSGAFIWNRNEANYSVEYMNLKHEPSSPSGLTPNKIETNLNRYLISAQPKSRDGYEENASLKYDIGLEIRQRSADVTSPSVYMPNQNSGGVRLGGSYFKELDETLYVDARFGVFLPMYHDELGAKTGHYRFSFNPDLSATIGYKLGSKVDISAGVMLIYERIFYSGNGDRGTSKAEETYFTTTFPIELKFYF